MRRSKKNTQPGTKLQSQSWQFQTAKAQFSELFRRARTEGPQVVTRQGKEQVVVLPAEQFVQLTKRVRQAEELGEILCRIPARSPHARFYSRLGFRSGVQTVSRFHRWA